MRVIAVLTALAAVAILAGAGQTRETQESMSASRMIQTYDRAVATIAQFKPCPSARKAIVYYRAQTWQYQRELGEQRKSTYYPERKKYQCAYKRWVSKKWQKLAIGYRNKVAQNRYHFAWERWLPDKWQRIGACETGYGTRPGRWDWNSGSFQGAFGFWYGTWDVYKPTGAPSEAYLATPRQQYQAALNVYAVHGYGAWGCGGA